MKSNVHQRQASKDMHLLFVVYRGNIAAQAQGHNLHSFVLGVCTRATFRRLVPNKVGFLFSS